jgi:mannose-1-phosphate guanylyltransferase/mannose-6-phosphate isomerase
MIPVILSGGSGTRLWPLSRKSYPKQFLSFADSDKSMLQETVLRLKGLRNLEAPYIVCNNEHRFLIAEQLREIECQPSKIILEPVARNTAPAVAVAALEAIKTNENALLLVLSADHVIKDISAFHQAIAKAEQLAHDNYLVTFGISPDKPETGYGYILRNQAIETVADSYTIERFVEKPDLATAEAYVESGEYYWNSGMFLFKASRYIEELEKYAPEILLKSQCSLQKSQQDNDFLRLDKTAFQACPNDSIDYAVMENTDTASLVHLDALWSDGGAWAALF